MYELQIIEADLDRPDHAQAVVDLTDAYSRDPMGDGKPLDEDVRRRLIPGLKAHPTTHIFLAYEGDRAIGMALCFRGFSSFYARPLINIHDLSVVPEARGRGVGRKLLEAVAAKGRALDCCKLTLETQDKNPARRLYESVGFARDVHVDDAGAAIFMTMKL